LVASRLVGLWQCACKFGRLSGYMSQFVISDQIINLYSSPSRKDSNPSKNIFALDEISHLELLDRNSLLPQ